MLSNLRLTTSLGKFSESKLEQILPIALIILAIFLRLFLIRDYVLFLGDEGRDMLVMRKMLLEIRPTFLGPTASVGGFYLGPIYYWMAAPFLLFTNFDPVGPSYFVALIGVATVYILFKFLKVTVGFWPAILASVLYATAPLIVRYSRSSWNPNPLPFFALMLIYFLYLGLMKQKYLFFLFAGLAFGVAFQLHYLAIMLIPVSALIVVLNSKPLRWPLISAFAIAGFLITFSPFLIFEIKHNFPNFKTIFEFVTRDSTHGIRNPNIVYIISNTGNILLEYISELKGTVITRLFFWTISISAIFGLILNWKKKEKLIFTIGVIWFLGGLFFLRYYSGQIFDYYYGFMFPAPFLLTGLVLSLAAKTKTTKVISTAAVTIILIWFLKNGFYQNLPNRLIDQTESVADFVIDKSDARPFNFALITEGNSDHAYRYFLEVKGHKPLELETLVTNQLLVVCESKKCAPLGHPIWEIAGFGRAEIVGEWEIPDTGIRVFRLTHWPGAESPAGKPAVKGG